MESEADRQKKAKTFLSQGSQLYAEMIAIAPSDTVRRYLAFRIIVNAMSYEDVISCRTSPEMRKIRDVLLAHKQEARFFEGFNACDRICAASIEPLLSAMAKTATPLEESLLLPELQERILKTKLLPLMQRVLAQYQSDWIEGHRITNNFFFFEGTSVHEVTAGNLAGVFYRYHSSKGLMDLAQYIYNNSYDDKDLLWCSRHAKLDNLLHSQNMADCILRDQHNHRSIDGLLEVVEDLNIGDPSSLKALAADADFQSLYARVRRIRNKLIGHFDVKEPLEALLDELDRFEMSDVYDLINKVDYAVYATSKTHPSLWQRYVTGNAVLTDPSIRAIPGIKARPYFAI